jgi:hypothetical protein
MSFFHEWLVERIGLIWVKPLRWEWGITAVNVGLKIKHGSSVTIDIHIFFPG